MRLNTTARKRAIAAAHLILLVGGLLALQAEPAQAQQTARRPTRVPVTLTLVDTLAAETPFRILRRANVEPHDVIVFRRGADPVALSAAVEQLVLMRQAQGDTSETTGVMRVRMAGEEGRPGARMLPWARRVMDDLHHASTREIAGVGTVPAVVIWLPPQRRRAAVP